MGAGIAGTTGSGSPRVSVGPLDAVCTPDRWGETQSPTCSVGQLAFETSRSSSSSCNFEQILDVATLWCPYL